MATTERMSVHQALAELKVIDDRIKKSMNQATFILANKHSNEKIDGKTINEVKDILKANHQKINDLMNRRNALKRAVVLSNAVTKINVIGSELTIAEAIDLKNHGMTHKKYLLQILNTQYKNAQSKIEQNSGEAIEKKAESYVLQFIQAQPKDSKTTVDSDLAKTIRKDYIDNNTYDLIDPLDVVRKMEELTEEIQKFETELDAALSVSNALTIIEISY